MAVTRVNSQQRMIKLDRSGQRWGSLQSPSLNEEPLATDSCWGKAISSFFEDVAISFESHAPVGAPYPCPYQQHQLDLLGY